MLHEIEAQATLDRSNLCKAHYCYTLKSCRDATYVIVTRTKEVDF